MGYECAGGWTKHAASPVLGGELGTVFDTCVLRGAGEYRMYCSWRDQKSIALSRSADGVAWSRPVICLPFDCDSDWQHQVNRPVVVRTGGAWHMWYTGQAGGRSWIGHAVSDDGVAWHRAGARPVLTAELPWEGVAVMCPHVLYDEDDAVFKMWYSAGEQYEPDAIGYATSADGATWTKHADNAVFAADATSAWERAKVTACQVIRRSDDYLMFYIGFRDVHYAQIGMARSADGVAGWERYGGNPIIRPGAGWDASAVYKPYAVRDDDHDRWLLYYNGRREHHEQIGIAVHEGFDLQF